MTRRFVPRACLLALAIVAFAPWAHSSDLVVSYRVLSSAPDGQMVRGTLLIKAVNTSGQDLNNVDLRFEMGSGGLAPVVQLGSLSISEIGSAVTEFTLSGDPATAEDLLDWTATYTDAAGTTHEAHVASSRDEEATQ